MNALLYALVVVIWGTTWIAITLQQQSEISTTVAVFWRFFISAIVLFAFVVMSRKLQKLATQDHYFACCRHAVFLDLTLSVSIMQCNTLVVAWKR